MRDRVRNTVFITGGSSGIGAGLARAFHARSDTVVIGGRDEAALLEVARSCPGMMTHVIDVADPVSVARCAEHMAADYPAMNVLVNNAGIQRAVDFAAEPAPTADDVASEVAVNLTGLMCVTAAFLPLLRRQPAARVVQVSSALAFAPLTRAPVYSATKAGVHAFTVAVREQLRGTSVRVIELIPPLVATNLHRGQGGTPAGAMPLDRFVADAMRGLDRGRDEVTVGLARVLRIGVRVSPGLFRRIVNKPCRPARRNAEPGAAPETGC